MKGGGIFLPIPSPALQLQVSPALLAGGEFLGCDSAAGVWNAFPTAPTLFPSVPHWGRAGLAGQALLAPHFHGELLQRSERSRGGLGEVRDTGVTPCSVPIHTSELIPEGPVWLGQHPPNSLSSLHPKQKFGIWESSGSFLKLQCRNFVCCAFRNGKAKQAVRNKGDGNKRTLGELLQSS